MNNKFVKISLDIVMTALMLILMNVAATGYFWHELLGLFIFGLFIVHNLLNMQWIKGVTASFFNKFIKPKTRFMYVLDVLLLIFLSVTTLSGILISKALFTSIALDNGVMWSAIHTSFSYGSLILISVHIGMHWKYVMGAFRKMFNLRTESKPRTILLRSIAALLVVVGIKNSFTTDVGSKLLVPLTITTSSTQTSSSTGTVAGTTEVIDTDKLSSSIDLSGSSSATATNETTAATNVSTSTGVSTTTTSVSTETSGVTASYLGNATSGSTSTKTVSTASNLTASTAVDENTTLDDYLGSLICTACHRRCSLLSPQCGRGVQQVERATSTFEELKAEAVAAASATTIVTEAPTAVATAAPTAAPTAAATAQSTAAPTAAATATVTVAPAKASDTETTTATTAEATTAASSTDASATSAPSATAECCTTPAPTDSEAATGGSAVTTDSSTTTSDDSSAQAVTSTTTVADDDSVTLEQYLGSLYCTACHKQCSLLSPQCGKGVVQAEQATTEYQSLYSSSSSSEDSTVVASAAEAAEAASQGTGASGMMGGLGTFFPMMTLYVAGTYYTVEFLEKSRKKED